MLKKKEKEKKEDNHNNGNKLEKEQIIIRVMLLGPYLIFHFLYLTTPKFCLIIFLAFSMLISFYLYLFTDLFNYLLRIGTMN